MRGKQKNNNNLLCKYTLPLGGSWMSGEARGRHAIGAVGEGEDGGHLHRVDGLMQDIVGHEEVTYYDIIMKSYNNNNKYLIQELLRISSRSLGGVQRRDLLRGMLRGLLHCIQ